MFSCTSFDICEKFVASSPPTSTPTQKLKSVFSILSSQETGSSSVSLKMIFGALQFELFRFKIHSLGSKILKFPELNLDMTFYRKYCPVKRYEKKERLLSALFNFVHQAFWSNVRQRFYSAFSRYQFLFNREWKILWFLYTGVYFLQKQIFEFKLIREAKIGKIGI